jgi:glycosyltransferase involved in cell wall biosynthesis
MMSKTPLVSVCVTVYNYGRFLSTCIESVQAQTISDWELIIGDDCSTDNTAEIAQAFADSDPRIRYIRNPQRLGMNGNIKRVADQGRGAYLKILCADDWLVPNCLEILTRLLDDHPVAVLATSAETLCDESEKPLYVQFLFGERVSILPGETMLDRMAKGEGFGGHSSFLIRTNAYQAVGGYDDTLLYAADYDLAARLCRIGSYVHTDLPLFYARVQPESSSSVNPKKLLDVIDNFAIPAKIFQPRRFANKEWRRYQMLTGNLTARYMINFVLQHLRGEHAYSRNLGKLLRERGNFLLGLPLLIWHIPLRGYRKLSGTNRPASLPVGEVMSVPTFTTYSD